MYFQANTAPNPLAKEELNLLAKLMGSMEVQECQSRNSGFRVNLFATDQEEEEAWVAEQISGSNAPIVFQCPTLWHQEQVNHLIRDLHVYWSHGSGQLT